MKTAAPKTETAIQKAFSSPVDFRTEGGSVYMIRKWSVRKFTTMGRAVSTVIESVFSIITDQRRADYSRAVEAAKAKGLEDGDDGWPNASAYEQVGMNDVISAIPAAIETAANEMAIIVAQSLTSPENGSVHADEVLDEFTIGDLAEALESIIEINFDKATVGKLKGLLEKMMKRMAG